MCTGDANNELGFFSHLYDSAATHHMMHRLLSESDQSRPKRNNYKQVAPTFMLLGSVGLKSRAITLPTKVHVVKAMGFPIVMYGCQSFTIKKADCERTDAFELCCWRLLRVPWIARRSHQSIPKEINPEYTLEGLMLKLKPQYSGHLM